LRKKDVILRSLFALKMVSRKSRERKREKENNKKQKLGSHFSSPGDDCVVFIMSAYNTTPSNRMGGKKRGIKNKSEVRKGRGNAERF
jgi:hypothetical protein